MLNGFGIRLVGVTTSKDIASHIKAVIDLKDLSLEELTNIEGIGPKVAQSIYDFFQTESNIHLIHALQKLGVNTVNRPGRLAG